MNDFLGGLAIGIHFCISWSYEVWLLVFIQHGPCSFAPGSSRREIDPRNDQNAGNNNTGSYTHSSSEKKFWKSDHSSSLCFWPWTVSRFLPDLSPWRVLTGKQNGRCPVEEQRPLVTELVWFLSWLWYNRSIVHRALVAYSTRLWLVSSQ